MIDRLFTYGTLEISSVVKRVLGRDLVGRPAVLNDYARYLVRGESYPAIREEPGSAIRGTLYDGIDGELFRRLDKYEGEEYRKRPVQVLTDDGRPHHAFVYTCSADLLSEQSWDQAAFIAHHLGEFMDARSSMIE
jgi:gamma-glutamylcyclotransferase (GGCT)/AIG2-like uncharacterized protein YtfP